MRGRLGVIVVTGLVLAAAPAAAAGATGSGAPSTTRVNVSSTGAQDSNGGFDPAISADGRYVAFVSGANNLVPGDTNNTYDVFVRDRMTGTTSRVSLSSSGGQGNDGSSTPVISADGRYVAFESLASNLVPGDTNGYDIFVRDRLIGTTSRVSLTSSGAQGNSSSSEASISADGRYVAFESYATNLVPGDTNGSRDVFVRDRLTGTTSRVSLNSSGAQGNGLSVQSAISADGRYVAYDSDASNLVPGDANGVTDVFVRDRVTGTTSRVNLSSTGVQGNGGGYFPAISADGRYVAFASAASNLVPGDINNAGDVFVRDRGTGTTSLVSRSSSGAQGNNLGSSDPAISADGRYVAFFSDASNLVPGDTNGGYFGYDVFVRDRVTGTTSRVSVSSTGAQGNDDSYDPAISADGRYVAFISSASNLVPGDTNQAYDIFVRDRGEVTAAASCDGLAATLVGTAGDDTLTGTAGNDVIAGRGGNDAIEGGGGNDVICGGDGNDTLRGGVGDDRIFGQAGDDRLFGDAGDDHLAGGTGTDACLGGTGFSVYSGCETARGG